MSRLYDAIERADRLTLAAVAVMLAAGAVTFAVASTVFRYHSINHDEAVYLTQAAMLLAGRVELAAGALAEGVRPWFFIQDGGRLYPKYTPVPAAMYAVSMALFDEPRVTLAAVAAANAGLVYALGGMVFDRRVGLAAAVVFAASPLAIVTGATFLPYAPTTCLNLLFAVAYLRGVRDESVVAGGGAGVAIGLAFFARPYTAVVFATPFILHALSQVQKARREHGMWPVSAPVRRQGLTALFGAGFVAVALVYNRRLTGSFLTFPYQAFAPMDGPGFGTRQILGHTVAYTPALALESNAYALWFLLTRWVAAGPVGAVLALVGFAMFVRQVYAMKARSVGGSSPPHWPIGGVLLAGVALSVSVGNVFFWGTHNLLATHADPTDGLVAVLGPFYHFDLLVPLSVFGGVAIASGWRAREAGRAWLETRCAQRTARALLAALVVAALVTGGITAGAAAATPLERNAEHTAAYEAAYEPFERTSLENAVVFVPTPYGEWQQHPFQWLRNDPGLDGEVVYVLDRGPAADFAALEAYPERVRWRYAIQGEWDPDGERVVPKLEPIVVKTGAQIDAETTVGVPAPTQRVRVQMATAGGGSGESVEYGVRDPDASLAVDWSVGPGGARFAGARFAGEPNATVPFDPDGDTLVVTVTLVDAAGATVTYRQEAAVRVVDGRVEVIWPPARSVCRLVTACDTDGTYVPGSHAPWVSFETTARGG